MRILLVTDWNQRHGGAEGYITCLRSGLEAAGDEVRLLTSSAGDAGHGSADFVAFGTSAKAAQAVLQIANPHAALTVWRAVREFRPDVAVVNMFALHLSAVVFNALGSVATVLLVSDYKCICPVSTKLLPDGSICRVPAGFVCRRKGCLGTLHWLRDQPRYALIRSGLRRPMRIVACSEWMRGELARNGLAADTLLFPVPAPLHPFPRRPASSPTFVTCGRLDTEKGVDLLLRAFARLVAKYPEARLRILGDGPLRESLETLAARLNLTTSVTFFGWMQTEGIEAALVDAWALVVPSIWAEPLGLVAIEAIVRRVPVIASASGGLAEIVDEGKSGLLFANNDEDQLLSRLRAVASREAFPTLILEDGVVLAARETFDVGRHVDRLRRILREVVGVAEPTAS